MKIDIIYNDDALVRLEKLADACAGCIITSPPYYAYKSYSNHPLDFENAPTYENYLIKMNICIDKLYRVLVPGGRCCIVIDDKHTNLKTEGINKNRATHARIILMAEKAGFIYKDLIIWAKARVGHASGGARYMLGSFPYPPNIPLVNWFEYILIFHKEGKRKVSKEIKEKSKLSFVEFKWASQSIWSIPAEKDRSHPAPFPEIISSRLIRLFSFYNDIILDPFIGSGTTAISAIKNNRHFIGIDISKESCVMAKERINRELNQLKLSL